MTADTPELRFLNSLVCLEFSKSALSHNFHLANALSASRNVELMVVTKAVCSFPPLVSLLANLGAEVIGDSQPDNLRKLAIPAVKKVLLKSPPSALDGESWDYSLVSHVPSSRGGAPVVVVLEMGDGKDGIDPSKFVPFVRELKRSGRPFGGLACNFSCLLGRQPDAGAWVEFEKSVAEASPFLDTEGVFSAGGTVVLDDLEAGRTRALTQVRVGEGLLLGWDSSRSGPLEGFATETCVVWAEVLEVSLKDLGSTVLQGRDAFGRVPSPPPTGPRLRAVLDLGSLAAGVADLAPLEAGVLPVGQTFDFMVAELSGDARGLRVGDRVGFRPNYAALSQASLNPYVTKVLV